MELYTWDDTRSLFQEIGTVTSNFSEKYGEYSVARIDMSSMGETMLRTLENEIEWQWLFSEHRMILLTGISLMDTENDENGETISWNHTKALASHFQSILDHIPDTITILLILPKLDARTTLAKYIEKHAQKHVFSTSSQPEDRWIMSHTYRDMLLRRTEKVPASRASIFEQVRLYSFSHPVTEEVIDFLCPPSREDAIFKALDAIVLLQTELARIILLDLLKRESPWALFSSLITNLRTIVYILTFRSYNIPNDTIVALGIHPYVVQKTKWDEKLRKKLTSMLESLIESDRDLKTGKWLSDPELWILMAIDRGLFGLQKEKNGYTARTVSI